MTFAPAHPSPTHLRRLLAVLLSAVALLGVTGCASLEERSAPTCVQERSDILVLMAQAVPTAALVPCIACSQNIEPGSAFCRLCGAAQTASCPTCRAPVAKDSAFCAKCGQKLGS